MTDVNLTHAQEVGLEAIAAMKAHGRAYCDPPSHVAASARVPTEADIEEERQVLRQCLAMDDPDADDAIAEGVPREQIYEILRRERNRLLHQAQWVGEATMRFVKADGDVRPQSG